MNPRLRVWRQRWPLWAAPAALLLASLVLGGLYLGRFANREEALAARVASTRQELAEAVERRDALRARVKRRRQGERQLRLLYEERLGTQAEQLTATLVEIKRLAGRAGLRPGTIAYSSESAPEFGVDRQRLNFAVEGDWRQLREFVNLLELADPFVIVEDIGLNEAGRSGRLRISLRLSVAFAAAAARAGEERAS